MNPDILKPKEENLFSLAAEMGLVVLGDTASTEKEGTVEPESSSPTPKSFSQLT